MKKSTHCQLALSAFFYSSIFACTTGHPSRPSTSPTRAQPNTAPIEMRNKSWTPELIAGEFRYLIHDSSTVSINNDTTTSVTPIESIMIYSITTTDSNNTLVLTGHVDSLHVNSNLSTRAKPDTATTINLHMVTSKQGQLLSSPTEFAQNCSAINSPGLSRISELLIPLPVHATKVDNKWTDTLSIITCHGKIPLRHTMRREYELLDLSSSCQQPSGVQVRRIVTDTLTGSSTEANNHITANGFGTATSILCLEQKTGMLLTGDQQSHLELTVTTTRGVFPFTQNSNTHIALR